MWLLLLVAGAAFLVLQPRQASAACSPAAGSNITVTCSGTTTNQGPEVFTGYGDSTQNGLTLNVQSGASVIGTSQGIDVNNNNTINNLGTIATNGTTFGNVYGITANGPLTVNNSGTIGEVNLSSPDLAGVNTFGSGLSVTNNAGGVIQGSVGITGIGVGTVVNSGLINAVLGGGGIGINYDQNNTSSVTVTNNASGTITGDAYGIYANGANVTNYGTISAPTAGGVAISVNTLTLTNYASGVVTGDAGAISGSQTPTLTITNFGTISAGVNAGISGTISGNVVNVTNSGTISIASGSGGPAISMVSGSVINNASGSIIGDYQAIATSGNTTIFNAGTISANSGPAIFFQSVGSGGTGGNTLTLGPGFVINGTVIGAGSDTFQLGGVGTGAFNLSTIGTQYTGFTTFKSSVPPGSPRARAAKIGASRAAPRCKSAMAARPARSAAISSIMARLPSTAPTPTRSAARSPAAGRWCRWGRAPLCLPSRRIIPGRPPSAAERCKREERMCLLRQVLSRSALVPRSR